VLSLEARQKLATSVLETLKALNPAPTCELYYETGFQLLVSVVLSAQTTDKSVNACMRELYQNGFTPQTVLDLGEAGLLAAIRRIGLAPTKAKRVMELARLVRERHGGEVPRTREELEALPGVGRKTANVVLAELFREKTLAVDTHVFRVTRRLGLQRESTPDKCETELMKVVAPDYLPDAHHWFILHGRYVCKALKPDCDHCPLQDRCPSL
jgi:endonuclease-3